MKNLARAIFILTAIMISSSSVAQQKTVQKVVIKTTINCDHCKACETCGGLLEKTLIKTKGIQMITLNEKEATIEIIYNTKKTDLTTIKKAISNLGYDADDVKANAAAYDKLDGCCKPS